MLKATIFIVFIAFTGARLLSTKMIDISSDIFCYECFSSFTHTMGNQTDKDCEGSMVNDRFLRNKSNAFIDAYSADDLKNLVCLVWMDVANRASPKLMEHTFARALDPVNSRIDMKRPWGPKEKLRCVKDLAVKGHNSLEKIPAGKSGTIHCICISNGCNSISMTQLIKDFPNL